MHPASSTLADYAVTTLVIICLIFTAFVKNYFLVYASANLETVSEKRGGNMVNVINDSNFFKLIVASIADVYLAVGTGVVASAGGASLRHFPSLPPRPPVRHTFIFKNKFAGEANLANTPKNRLKPAFCLICRSHKQI